MLNLSPREAFLALRGYSGADAYGEVLLPWLERDAVMLRDSIAPLAVHGRWRRETYVWGDLLEQAYALSRLSDVLLLGFQPSLPAGAQQPLAHALHPVDEWPPVTAGQYLAVFTQLGMNQVDAKGFDPFFHEIVTVEQASDPDAPIEITGTVWPGLMLGEMLFSRAGVRVRAGTRRAEAGVADQSDLHWVFLRRYRATNDGSLGWGHNSQWKTDFRRDYLTPAAYVFNADGVAELDGEGPADSSPYVAQSYRDQLRRLESLPLTRQEHRDLLRHRCLVRTPENPAGLDASWPGEWRLTVPRPG